MSQPWRLRRLLPIGLLLAGLTAEAVSAQATGMPTFFAPTRGFASWEAGVSLSRPGGDRTSVEGRYAAALDRADIGLRGGYVEHGGGDGELAAGVEVRVPVLGRSPTFPLDGALVLGAGRVFSSGGGDTIVPAGLTIGRRLVLDASAFHLTPYIQPTVVFAGDTSFTFGLGLDLHLRGIPDLRLAWARGDWDGFSVSAFWPR